MLTVVILNSVDVNTNQPKVILISVGGAKEPLLFSLQQLGSQPEQIWFFCSKKTIPTAQGVLAEMMRLKQWAPLAEYIVEDDFEVLNSCYRTLRPEISKLLKKHQIASQSVLVDYTGGSKPMSAALVLAATEFFQNFAYVGGERNRNGVGTTLLGEEKLVQQTTNPWAVLAVREVERVADLWKGLQFEAAARLLRNTAEQVPANTKGLWTTFALVAEVMAARHRLALGEALSLLDKVYNPQEKITPLGNLFVGRDDFGLLHDLAEMRMMMRNCLGSGGANKILLRELLDNALRTAEQGRYEDAAARLYRALEMQGQLRLMTTSEGLFINGRCSEDNVQTLFNRYPDLDREKWGKTDREGRINLGLEQIFRCLLDLGDSGVKSIVEDLDSRGSRIRAVTKTRNEGMLAHGVSPVGKQGFEAMKQIAAEFFGMNLTQCEHPMPPFEPRWLQSD
jgi:CRISPR-associated protein (TIGR02710 family)